MTSTPDRQTTIALVEEAVTLLRQDIGQCAFLVDPCFVLQPAFQRFAARMFGQNRSDMAHEVFLGVSRSIGTRIRPKNWANSDVHESDYSVLVKT